MNIETRIKEIEDLESKSKLKNKFNIVSAILLYSLVFLIVFEHERILAVVMVVVLVVNARLFTEMYRIRIEGRVLRELKKEYT